MLPQDWEGSSIKTIDIRNKDIRAVVQSDLVLFNFDGTDLDSGTVVEFIIAKMLDIPTVLLRTDCRVGGYLEGEDWNLMVSGFPRCITIKHDALVMYNEYGLEKTHQIIASSIIDAFEKVILTKSLLSTHEEIFFAYNHVVKMCGSELHQLLNQLLLAEIIDAKIQKNIYCLVRADNNNLKQASV